MKTATAPQTELDAPAREAALKLFVVLSRASSAVAGVVEQSLDDKEITPTEFGILEALYHKGPLLHGEIQKKILVTSGGITYLVDRLVEKGLVRREECPNDRRARYAVLTDQGRELMGRVFPAHAERIVHAVAGLTQREQADATRLLRKLGLAAAKLGN